MKLPKRSWQILCTALTMLTVCALPAVAADSEKTTEAPADVVENTLVGLQSGLDLKQAYATLQDVPTDSKNFRMTYLEIQKLHYRDQAWDRFFGYATFYRKKLSQQFFEPTLLLLEGLALIKHCQFDAAQNVISASQSYSQQLRSAGEKADGSDTESQGSNVFNLLAKKEIRRESKKSLSEKLDRFDANLKAVSTLLFLQSKMQGYILADASKRNVQAFTKTLFWNVSDVASARTQLIERAILNPRSLRVFVKNSCQKGQKL